MLISPPLQVIQDMRKTKHTSEFMASLGPFFVGERKWQYPQNWEAYEQEQWGEKMV